MCMFMDYLIYNKKVNDLIFIDPFADKDFVKDESERIFSEGIDYNTNQFYNNTIAGTDKKKHKCICPAVNFSWGGRGCVCGGE